MGDISLSTKSGESHTLKVLSLADGKETALGVEAIEPFGSAFSPDGQWIAHTCAHVIVTCAPRIAAPMHSAFQPLASRSSCRRSAATFTRCGHLAARSWSTSRALCSISGQP